MPSFNYTSTDDYGYDDDFNVSIFVYAHTFNVHSGAKKTAPRWFCNNFGKTCYSEKIIGTYILQ